MPSLKIEKQLITKTIDDKNEALKNSGETELAEKDVDFNHHNLSTPTKPYEITDKYLDIRHKTDIIQPSNVANLVVLKIQSKVLTQIGKDNEIIELNRSVKTEGESTQPCENTDLESESDTVTPGGRFTGTSIYGDEVFPKERKSHGTEANKRPRRCKRKAKNSKIKEGLGRTVHKSLPPASPSASCTELCRVSDDVMMQLQVVRDNGRWDVFEKVVVTLSQTYTSSEAQIVILLERSMAACYQNNLEESEKMIKTAIDMSKNVENGAILQGISCICIASWNL